MSELVGPVYAKQDYAGFIRRTVANLLDFVIVYAGATMFLTSLSISAPASWEMPDGSFTPQVEAWCQFGVSMAIILYMVGMRLFESGTLGYRIVRIRYAYALDGKPSVVTILYRAVMAVFLLWFFCLDHIWIIFDKRKQAWHDKVSGFYVVKCGARPTHTQRMNHRLIDFMSLSFPVWEPAEGEESA